MSKGAELIKKERLEQINKHKWNETDKDYVNGELQQAALFSLDAGEFSEAWPKGWGEYYRNKILNKTRIQQLAVAGAFIAAEIDRMLAKEKE